MKIRKKRKKAAMKYNLQLFGGRGATSGSKNSGNAKSIQSEIKDFADSISNREMGTGKGAISEERQKEFRAAMRSAKDSIESIGNADFALSSGFANNENYIHTSKKLNDYQRLIQKGVNDIITDMDLGILDAGKAKKEIDVYKVLDRTIQERRKSMKS